MPVNSFAQRTIDDSSSDEEWELAQVENAALVLFEGRQRSATGQWNEAAAKAQKARKGVIRAQNAMGDANQRPPRPLQLVKGIDWQQLFIAADSE